MWMIHYSVIENIEESFHILYDFLKIHILPIPDVIKHEHVIIMSYHSHHDILEKINVRFQNTTGIYF